MSNRRCLRSGYSSGYSSAPTPTPLAIAGGIAQAAADTNITLSGVQTVDGINLVAGDVCLALAQTTAANRGPWVVAAGAWTRPEGYDAGGESFGVYYTISGGTRYALIRFIATSAAAVIGTNDPVFLRMNGRYLTSPVLANIGTGVVSAFNGAGAADCDGAQGWTSAQAIAVNRRGLLVAMNDATFSHTFAVRWDTGIHNGGGGDPSVQIGVYESGGGRGLVFFIGLITGTPSIRIGTWTGAAGAIASVTANNTGTAVYGLGGPFELIFVKIDYDGTTYTFSYSFNNKNFFTYGTATKAANFGNQNPTHYCFLCDNRSTLASGTATLSVQHVV